MDESLINKIANGKRELSVGYTYELKPNGDGSYTMHDLVANHIAVCESGTLFDNGWHRQLRIPQIRTFHTLDDLDRAITRVYHSENGYTVVTWGALQKRECCGRCMNIGCPPGIRTPIC